MFLLTATDWMSALDEYAEIVLGSSVIDHPLTWAIAYERIYWVRFSVSPMLIMLTVLLLCLLVTGARN